MECADLDSLSDIGEDDIDFRRKLINRGYRVIEIDKDGNCQYSAIALAVKGDLNQQGAVRKELQYYIRKRVAEYVGFFEGFQDFVDALFDMTRDGVWGDQFTLRAASMLYKKNIVVISPPFSQVEHAEDEHFAETIFLSFHNGNHYNLLTKEKRRPRPLTPTSDSESEVEKKNKSEKMDLLDNDSNSEDDEYDTDDSKHDDHDESDSSQDEDTNSASLLEMDGFQFVGSKCFRSGRDYVNFIVIIPTENHSSAARSLTEEIQNSNPDTMYFLVDYGKNLHLLKHEEYFDLDFVAYSQRKYLPRHRSMQERMIWISSIMCPWFILTFLKYKWKNQTAFLLLSPYGTNSILCRSLKYTWNQIREDIIDDTFAILQGNHDLVCMECPRPCQSQSKAWHINLHEFRKVDHLSDGKYGFWKRVNFYLAWVPTLGTTFETFLSQIRNHPGSDHFQHICNTLDQLAKQHSSDIFWTYLVIIFGGPNMEKHTKSPVQELINDKTVIKSLYAGITTGKAKFRRTHFTGTSPINRILTKHDRMFFIRSKRFTSTQEAEARLDEGFIIELLKNYISKCISDNREKPFILLNSRSESKSMLPMTEPLLRDLLGFCISGIPIYQTDPTDTRKFSSSVFTGNYQIEAEIEIPADPFSNYTFEDVKEVYDMFATRPPR